MEPTLPPEHRVPLVRPNESYSYWQLLSDYREYRLFILSYLITHLGEWLTYIASIDFIEQQQQEDNLSRTSISILIIVRLLPNVVLSAFGGSLADSMDRRRIMIVLDICGALCALLFVTAYRCQSLFLLYLASTVQQCIAGVYQPSHSAIIPQLVQDDPRALKKATTLEGLTWSCMTAFGAAASGILVSLLGIEWCFVIDGGTYLLSALLLAMVRGDYNVSETSSQQQQHHHQPEKESPWKQLQSMTIDGARYLQSSSFGALVLLKALAALAYGACDVLNVAFSEQHYAGDDTEAHDSNSPMERSSLRMGILFSAMGVGCLVGPLLVEPHVDVEKPSSLQLSCVICYGISALGYFGWSVPGCPFWAIVLVSMIRSGGSSTIWINSNLLLQTFSSDQMMGRVMAADYALALLTEAAAAFGCGKLMDYAGYSASDVSLLLAILTTVFTVGWAWYHTSGRGAAAPSKEHDRRFRFRQESSSGDGQDVSANGDGIRMGETTQLLA